MIDALLFDLAGVIMDIDEKRVVNAFKALGMTDADKFFDPFVQRGPFLQLEKGAITPDEFYKEMRPYFSHHVTDEQIDQGLYQFLAGIPDERLVRLKELRQKGYKVYLLSNTNVLNWNGVIIPEFRKHGGDINDYFDGIVTSFEAGYCKPDARIFRYAIECLGLIPENTTFYDDSLTNVEAARALGFKVELVTTANSMLKLCSDMLASG